MGLQILGPAQKVLAVLQIAHAWEQASGTTKRRSPLLA
jgi:amidase